MRRRGVHRVVGLACLLAGAACDSGRPKQEDDKPAVTTAPAADSIVDKHTLDLGTGVVTDALGLPASGKVEVSVDLQHAKADLRKASGTVRIRCAGGCRLGDDVAKLTPKLKNARANAFVGDGISFGHIDFDSFDVVLDVANGVATITKWDVQSKDIALIVDGTLTLGHSLSDSVAKLCVRFAPTPGLRERDARTSAVVDTTGAPRSTKDGMYNIELVDRIDQLKKLGRVCDGSGDPPAPVLAPDLSSGAGSAAPTADAPLDPATEALIAAAVTQTSATSFDVNLGKIQKLLSDPAAFSRGARLVPAVRDGHPFGFKLYAIRPGSLYAKLGFQNGDTLTSVDGKPLATADQALEIYTSLRGLKAGETLTVLVERTGDPVILRYTLR